MKKVFLQAMNEPFDLSTMIKNIDYYHARGKLPTADREELVAIAREKASPFGGLDVAAKLQELDERIATLENASAESSGTTNENIKPYVPGKWYFNGNRMIYNGTIYTCIAPVGAVCTWSPDEHPAYWEAE